MSQGIRSPFGNEYRAKLSLKDRNRDISSALLNVQVTVDGELIGSENLVTNSEVPASKFQGTDFDMDVTFVAVDLEQMEKNKQEQRRQKEEAKQKAEAAKEAKAAEEKAEQEAEQEAEMSDADLSIGESDEELFFGDENENEGIQHTSNLDASEDEGGPFGFAAADENSRSRVIPEADAEDSKDLEKKLAEIDDKDSYSYRAGLEALYVY